MENEQNQHSYEYVTTVKEQLVADWLAWNPKTQTLERVDDAPASIVITDNDPGK